jgi:dUTP pyrophosphatase
LNKIEFAKLNDRAILPTRKHPQDAGIDLYANGNYMIYPGKDKIVRTGISVKIPTGYFGLIKPKGKSNHLVGAGVIDEGYQGELLIKCVNYRKEATTIVITHGAAIAQLLLIPTIYPKIEEVSINELYLEESDRGKTGGIVTELNNEPR